MFFNNSQPCPFTLMKKVIEYQYVFRSGFNSRQEVNDEKTKNYFLY